MTTSIQLNSVGSSINAAPTKKAASDTSSQDDFKALLDKKAQENNPQEDKSSTVGDKKTDKTNKKPDVKKEDKKELPSQEQTEPVKQEMDSVVVSALIADTLNIVDLNMPEQPVVGTLTSEQVQTLQQVLDDGNAQMPVTEQKTENMPLLEQASTQQLMTGEESKQDFGSKMQTLQEQPVDSVVKPQQVKTEETTSTNQQEKNVAVKDSDTMQKSTESIENKVVENKVELTTVKTQTEKQETKPVAELVQAPAQPVKEDVITIKVGDAVNIEQTNGAEKLAEKVLENVEIAKVSGKNEFEIQLMPEHLGKIMVKIAFEGDKVIVNMFCSSDKTMNLLSEHARGISAIIENNTGNQTSVHVQQEESNYLNQQRENFNNRNQENQQQQHNKKQQDVDSVDFIQQMRLGLVQAEGYEPQYNYF